MCHIALKLEMLGVSMLQPLVRILLDLHNALASVKNTPHTPRIAALNAAIVADGIGVIQSTIGVFASREESSHVWL